MGHRIITISREFGSGGRTIGKKLGEKLGIPCYDEELITRIAEESGFATDFIKANSEYASSPVQFGGNGAVQLGGLFAGLEYRSSPTDTLWGVQKKVILELAEKGPCIIVGRCADYILRGKADCFTVFIHASLEKRAERVVKVYGESDVAPEKRLKTKDKRRRAYFQMYTDMEWGDVNNYQIALDSGVLGIERCVEILAAAYRLGEDGTAE